MAGVSSRVQSLYSGYTPWSPGLNVLVAREPASCGGPKEGEWSPVVSGECCYNVFVTCGGTSPVAPSTNVRD